MTQKTIFKKPFLVTVVLTAMISAGAVVAHEWMAPKDSQRINNPVPYSPESTARGKELFLNNCAACHGDNAGGLSAAEAGLKMDAPDLGKKLSTHSDGDFYWKIENGKSPMPAFKGKLEDQQIWDIINFIKKMGNKNESAEDL